ncbi:MAG: hypothetical protein AUH72_03535 [Acidobacteria bacterium 13_1_40CM_4_65_8]|nr:MAG: hypothetical protein AUH72_03535 [Acidobacteria bacterium 13_1_40CM_4_65_8]
MHRRTLNQFVAQPLMIPFAMVMGDKLGDGSTEMVLAEWNQPIETFILDRADESVRRRRSNSVARRRAMTAGTLPRAATQTTCAQPVCSATLTTHGAGLMS